jgi:NADH-quinone oxidoreductase subunit C/D
MTRNSTPMTEQHNNSSLSDDLNRRFAGDIIGDSVSNEGMLNVWVDRESVPRILNYLKNDLERPYGMLYDLTAVDERLRTNRADEPEGDFTVVYHLLSVERDEDIRIKTSLSDDSASAPSVTKIWPAADWYEREVFDMFGITFDNHPHLVRILMPRTWKGHPLRKDHHARATEAGVFTLSDEKQQEEQDALQFNPEEWGMSRESDESEFIFLNLGPQHPGTHGVLRIVLQLDGELIIDAVPDIGFHHRGAEKMGERQSWHTYIPYTDRIDYLGGVLNNLPYVMAVETLAGIEVPQRAQVIRVMLCELFRIASHLVWYGTFAQDVGALSPVFYMFSDRERIFRIVEAITGDRMHPNWFRIGGVADDLPRGWDELVREFIKYFRKRIKEYDSLVMKNNIFRARTVGVGAYDTKTAIEWGVTGPGLRATGLEFDFRRRRPYSGYDQFEFEIPTATRGDCYDRAVVRVNELRQSLRIIEQCVENMPEGDYKARHHLTTPPYRDGTMHDIETLINHFLNVSWGPVIPAGEATVMVEASKGSNAYHLISDHDTMSYRTRIRTPSFPHLQMVPLICRGETIADLLAILGSIDFVLADVDR